MKVSECHLWRKAPRPPQLTIGNTPDNDMDSMGEPVSNRGNKLKRKAAFTQQGRLNNTETYKRVRQSQQHYHEEKTS